MLNLNLAIPRAVPKFTRAPYEYGGHGFPVGRNGDQIYYVLVRDGCLQTKFKTGSVDGGPRAALWNINSDSK